MRTIDDEIKFHLSEAGWYLGDSKIEIVKDRLPILGIGPECINFTNAGELAWTDGHSINLKESLGWVASLPQLVFATLHEHFHMKLGHCIKDNNMSSMACYEREYACDRLALKHLIKSGDYNRMEILDAIALFRDIVIEEASATHPSSKSRYKRLMEYVS